MAEDSDPSLSIVIVKVPGVWAVDRTAVIIITRDFLDIRLPWLEDLPTFRKWKIIHVGRVPEDGAVLCEFKSGGARENRDRLVSSVGLGEGQSNPLAELVDRFTGRQTCMTARKVGRAVRATRQQAACDGPWQAPTSRWALPST